MPTKWRIRFGITANSFLCVDIIYDVLPTTLPLRKFVLFIIVRRQIVFEWTFIDLHQFPTI